MYITSIRQEISGKDGDSNSLVKEIFATVKTQEVVALGEVLLENLACWSQDISGMLGILKDCVLPSIVMHLLDKCEFVQPGTTFIDPINVAVLDRDNFSLAILAIFHLIVLQHHLLQHYLLGYLECASVNYIKMLFATDCQLFILYLSNAPILKVICPLDLLDI